MTFYRTLTSHNNGLKCVKNDPYSGQEVVYYFGQGRVGWEWWWILRHGLKGICVIVLGCGSVVEVYYVQGPGFHPSTVQTRWACTPASVDTLIQAAAV